MFVIRRPTSARGGGNGDAPAVSKKKPETVDLHVAMRVKSFREGRMTQEQLASHLGITFQQIQKYERGANRISVGRFFEIARVLDVPVARFFEGLDAAQSARTGFAETEAAPYDAGPDPSEARVVSALRSIKDETVRKTLVELLVLLARRDAADAPIPRKQRV